MSIICICGGMCGCLQTRSKPDGSVTRRYECKQCKERFTTTESICTTAKKGPGSTAAKQFRDRLREELRAEVTAELQATFKAAFTLIGLKP